MVNAWSTTSALAIDTVGKTVKWGFVPMLLQPSWDAKDGMVRDSTAEQQAEFALAVYAG